jgi:hypothetical protein
VSSPTLWRAADRVASEFASAGVGQRYLSALEAAGLRYPQKAILALAQILKGGEVVEAHQQRAEGLVAPQLDIDSAEALRRAFDPDSVARRHPLIFPIFQTHKSLVAPPTEIKDVLGAARTVCAAATLLAAYLRSSLPGAGEFVVRRLAKAHHDIHKRDRLTWLDRVPWLECIDERSRRMLLGESVSATPECIARLLESDDDVLTEALVGLRNALEATSEWKQFASTHETHEKQAAAALRGGVSVRVAYGDVVLSRAPLIRRWWEADTEEGFEQFRAAIADAFSLPPSLEARSFDDPLTHYHTRFNAVDELIDDTLALISHRVVLGKPLVLPHIDRIEWVHQSTGRQAVRMFVRGEAGSAWPLIRAIATIPGEAEDLGGLLIVHQHALSVSLGESYKSFEWVADITGARLRNSYGLFTD